MRPLLPAQLRRVALSPSQPTSAPTPRLAPRSCASPLNFLVRPLREAATRVDQHLISPHEKLHLISLRCIVHCCIVRHIVHVHARGWPRTLASVSCVSTPSSRQLPLPTENPPRARACPGLPSRAQLMHRRIYNHA
jgi:hypothetical protein